MNTPTRVWSAQDWERQRPRIRDLYIKQGLSINKVIEHMARDYGFKATSRMYKSRLARWGFIKNVSREDWEAAAILRHDREKAGKETAALSVLANAGGDSWRIHGKWKTIRELERHIKGCGVSETEFITKAQAKKVRLSDNVRCVSPDPLNTEISSDDSVFSPSRSPGFSFLGPNFEPGRVRNGFKISKNLSLRCFRGSQDPQQLATTTPSRAVEMPELRHNTPSTDSTGIPFPSARSSQQAVLCDHAQQDLGFTLVQAMTSDAPSPFPQAQDLDSWALVSEPDPAAEEVPYLRFRAPSQSHSPLPLDRLWNRSSELPQSLPYPIDAEMAINADADDASEFQACCYAACMYGGQEKYDLLSKSLETAGQIFERMIKDNNSMILLSVLQALTILHAHNRGSLAESIIRSAFLVACRTIGEENSIALIMEWMTAAAGSKLAQSRIKTGTLRAVHTDHEKHFGEAHQHSIVSLYCLASNLVLDKEFAEAEEKFAHLAEICGRALGKRHLQTVSALNGLGESQTCQGKHGQAINTLKYSYDSHPFPENHPYRLESLRHLAMVYEKIGYKATAQALYWDVVRGRIETLGKTHTETKNARIQLEKLLKDMGKWDNDGPMAREVGKLFDSETAAVASDVGNFKNF